jgi:glycogen synthase
VRLWLLSSEFAADFAGGIGRYVENFAPLAADAGHDIVVIGRAREDFDRHQRPNLRTIGFRDSHWLLSEPAGSRRPDEHPAYPYNVLDWPSALSMQMASQVLRLAESLPRPQVIESQEYVALPYFLMHRKLTERTRLHDVPIVLHLHGPNAELLDADRGPAFRFPEYWCARMEMACVAMADAIVSPSRFLADRTLARLAPGKPEAAIDVIPYPIGLKETLPPAPGTRGDILYVGRLQLLKGVIPMIEGCERLWQAGADFRLTCIGSDLPAGPRGGSMREWIEKRFARRVSEGRLRLTGVMDHALVQQHMRDAWATIVGSTFENFPNVCIEAMNLGQIVLGSRSGGQAEMIQADGVNGFLFDWKIPGDFERQLRRILALPDGERLAIAANAQRRIREMAGPADVVRRRFEHFERVVRSHRPRTHYPALQTLMQPRLPADPPDGRPPARSTHAETPGLLSVVIPFYNLGAYLPETVASIRASTYRPYEIIIVNDGSTDPASLEVVAGYEREGRPDLRVVHTENSGLASTRNNGADAARGEFLCFLDADDCAEPHYFERAIDVLRRHANVDFVSSWIRFFGEADALWVTWNAEFPYLLGHNMCTAFSVLRRKSFQEKCRNKPEVAYAFEDHEMWISLLENGGLGVALAEPLVRYRVRKGSMLQTSGEAQQNYLLDVISQFHPQLYREFAPELFQLQQANGACRLWNHPAVSCYPPPNPATIELREWLDKLEEARAWSERGRLNAEKEIESIEASIEQLREIIARGGTSAHFAAMEELAAIENSRAWRTLGRLTLRFWRGNHSNGSATLPERRLAQIKASPSYRLICAFKESWIYRLVAKRK